MTTSKPVETEAFDLGIPLKSIPDSYLIGMLKTVDKIDNLIVDMKDPTDWRLLALVRQLVIRITDDDIREQLYLALQDAIDDVRQNPEYEHLDNQEKAEIFLSFAQQIEGSVVSWMDSALGISKKNLILDI